MSLETKISKITIASYKNNGYCLKRIKRDRRVAITYNTFIETYTNIENGIHQIKELCTHGVVILLENKDIDICSNILLGLLGSNNDVSCIWYITDRSILDSHKLLIAKYNPVKKHTRSNSGNSAWSGEYIIFCKGGHQKSIIVPENETDRQLANLWYDYCSTQELSLIQLRLKNELFHGVPCYLCGKQITITDYKYIDVCHIKSRHNLGFTNKNIAWGHTICNSIHGDMSMDILLKKIETILQYQSNKPK